MSEINPNHPVTSAVHDHWHKIVAILMHKFELGEVVITGSDLESLRHAYPVGMPSVLLHDKADGMHIKIVTEEEARRLAAVEGGLPS